MKEARSRHRRWVLFGALLLLVGVDQALLYRDGTGPEAALANLARDLGVQGERVDEVRRVLAFDQALFASDPVTLRTLAPDLDLEWPGLPGVVVQTNRHGMRMRPIEEEKAPGTLRVVCLGDSNTFGWAVREEACFARVLETELREEHPERGFEVLNLGVPGAGSRATVERAERVIPRFAPDVVTIGLGFNDSAWTCGMTDDERFARRWASSLRGWLRASWFGRRMEVWAAPKERRAEGPLRRRATPDEYEENVRRIATLALERGARVVLLNMCFPSRYAAARLEKLAAELNVEYLDGVALFAERDVDARPEPDCVGSWPADDGTATVRFHLRVPAGNEETGWALFNADVERIEGPESLPLFVTLEPDPERPGRWCAEQTVPAGSVIEFAFAPASLFTSRASLAGIKGRRFRTLRVGSSPSVIDSPVYELERYPGSRFMLEKFHPNEEGHRILGEALAASFETWLADRVASTYSKRTGR